MTTQKNEKILDTDFHRYDALKKRWKVKDKNSETALAVIPCLIRNPVP